MYLSLIGRQELFARIDFVPFENISLVMSYITYFFVTELLCFKPTSSTRTDATRSIRRVYIFLLGDFNLSLIIEIFNRAFGYVS